MLNTRIWIFNSYWHLILIASQLWSSKYEPSTSSAFILLSDNIKCRNSLGYEIHTYQTVRVQRGLCAHVPCTFTVPTDMRLSKNTNGFWYRSPGQTSVRVAFREDSIHYTNGRFYLIGDVTRGNCSFYIEKPLIVDEDAYFFRIEDPQIRFTYFSIRPYVEVTDLTDKPTISSTRLVDGKEVTMTCTSPGRCRNIKQPQISWEGAMTGTRQMISNTTYEDGSRTFHSNITFTPRKSHNNSPLSCRVTFQEDLSTMEMRTMNVEYFPSIDITIEGVDSNDMTSVIVEDGDSVTLRCIVDSNPNASVNWYKDDLVVLRNITDQIVTIQLNIVESDVGRYQCSAMNEHGVAHKSIQITYHARKELLHYMIIISTIGAICLLLLALLVYACWRKRLKNSRSAETEDTYTDLKISEITEIYYQLKTRSDTADVGSGVDADNDYENVL